MPWFVMYTAIVVYHAPQMKNCRNIIAPRRVPIERMACVLDVWSRAVVSVTGCGVVLDEVRTVRRRLRIHAALEVQDLDFPEVRRRTLRLQRDPVLRERLARYEHAGLGVVRRAAAHLGLAVLEHCVAVRDVLHDGIAEHQRFNTDP